MAKIPERSHSAQPTAHPPVSQGPCRPQMEPESTGYKNCSRAPDQSVLGQYFRVPHRLVQPPENGQHCKTGRPACGADPKNFLQSAASHRAARSVLFTNFCQKKTKICLAIPNRYRDRDRKTMRLGHGKPDVCRLAIDDVLPAMGSRKSISIPIAIAIAIPIKPYTDKRLHQTLILCADDACLVGHYPSIGSIPTSRYFFARSI